MLIRFWVQNYRCFRRRAEIDFTDKRNYAFGKECVRGDLLEKVVIIGENGSGKTSFGYALVDIVSTVNGFTRDIGQNTEECFINGYGDSDVATFHYEFTHRGSVVVYEYSKPSPLSIRSERMAIDGKTVFDYDLSDMSTAVLDLQRIGIRWVPDPAMLNEGSTLIKELDRKGLIDDYSPARPIIDFARNSLYYLAMWRMDDHIGQVDYDVKVAEYIADNHLEKDLQVFMRDQCGVSLDIDVRDGRLVVLVGSREVPFFSGVSRGMAIMCRLFAWITQTRDRDALIYFDDFDDLFDYRTAERVMGYIIEGSPSQCIFVTHNIDLIASEHLRPDCCFIMRDRQLRSLASLTDKTIRRGHNLAKMLRDGVFDEDPSQGPVPGSSVERVRRAREDLVQQVHRPVHAQHRPADESLRMRRREPDVHALPAHPHALRHRGGVPVREQDVRIVVLHHAEGLLQPGCQRIPYRRHRVHAERHAGHVPPGGADGVVRPAAGGVQHVPRSGHRVADGVSHGVVQSGHRIESDRRDARRDDGASPAPVDLRGLPAVLRRQDDAVLG